MGVVTHHRAGGLMHRRTDQRMAKPYFTRVDRDQHRRHRRRQRVEPHAFAEQNFAGIQDLAQRLLSFSATSSSNVRVAAGRPETC
ncbi:MAG: hypothetical protein WDM81_10430 [Rhizomicrobium sp.]